MPHIPSHQIRFGQLENGLKLVERRCVHRAEVTVGKPPEQEVRLLRPAMPASKQNPFTSGSGRFVVVFHSLNTNDHDPGPE